jgi:hypothetical protein
VPFDRNAVEIGGGRSAGGSGFDADWHRAGPEGPPRSHSCPGADAKFRLGNEAEAYIEATFRGEPLQCPKVVSTSGFRGCTLE